MNACVHTSSHLPRAPVPALAHTLVCPVCVYVRVCACARMCVSLHSCDRLHDRSVGCVGHLQRGLWRWHQGARPPGGGSVGQRWHAVPGSCGYRVVQQPGVRGWWGWRPWPVHRLLGWHQRAVPEWNRRVLLDRLGGRLPAGDHRVWRVNTDACRMRGRCLELLGKLHRVLRRRCAGPHSRRDDSCCQRRRVMR